MLLLWLRLVRVAGGDGVSWRSHHAKARACQIPPTIPLPYEFALLQDHCRRFLPLHSVTSIEAFSCGIVRRMLPTTKMKRRRSHHRASWVPVGILVLLSTNGKFRLSYPLLAEGVYPELLEYISVTKYSYYSLLNDARSSIE